MTKTHSPDWEKFIELCLKAQDKNELKKLFDLFMTIEEKETLATRYTIIKSLLKEELTQREIAKKSAVSIAKITRGSNALKIITPQLKAFLKNEMRISTDKS